MSVIQNTSIMRVLFPFVVLLLSDVIFAKTGNVCTLPNGEKATCKPVRLCEVIVSEIRKGNDNAISFARDSECGYENEQLVCCGSSNIFTTNTIFRYSRSYQDLTNRKLPDRTVCGFSYENDNHDRKKTDYSASVVSPVMYLYGGEKMDFDELPWVAALEYNNRFSNKYAGICCGGSVINNRYILTAAHCLGSLELELIGVRLGELDVNTDPDCLPTNPNICADSVQKFKIQKKIPHRFYDRYYGNNDIGLIKLDRNIKFSRYIRPICLPFPDMSFLPPNIRMATAGWGAIENNTRSSLKLRVEVPMVPNTVCKNWPKYKHISSNQLCAGGEVGKDACMGDSGGPLMISYVEKITGRMQWYQEGIVAWGSGCAFRKPSIYTRVGKYIKWIMRKISE